MLIDIFEVFKNDPNATPKEVIESFFEYTLKEIHNNYMFMSVEKKNGNMHLLFKHCETREYIKIPFKKEFFLNNPTIN